METKEQIKRSLSIVDVASLYVRLKPAGKNFKALCPFHSEKTPSFFVMPDRNTFACFGCHKFGDVFSLVQEMENLSFPEAMDFLIERFNLPVERSRNAGRRPVTDAYLKINELALHHFRANLTDTEEGSRALAYLADRGITDSTIEGFSIGYARNEWDALQKDLVKSKADMEKALELGLLARSQGGRVYDRFRGRIMFPIQSESGSVIAFGGRTLLDDPAKYMNSPDSPLFHKSHHLYGFYQAKKHIREERSAVLVEGYFDVVSLHQHGIQNSVAALGTALASDQVHLLNRFTSDIFLFYDGDDAGVKATLRGVERMLSHNISPRIISCGAFKDPDELVRKEGSRGVIRQTAEADDGFQYLLSREMEAVDIRRPEKKRDAIEQVMQVVAQIPDAIVRGEYQKRTAEAFGIEEGLLRGRKVMAAKEPGRSAGSLLIPPADWEFLHSLLACPELVDEIRPLMSEEILSVLSSSHLIRQLLIRYNASAQRFEGLDGIWKDLSDPEAALFQEMLLAADGSGLDRPSHCRRVEGSFLNFQDRLNKHQLRELNVRIRVAEREDNQDEIDRLMEQKRKYLVKKYKVVKEEPFDKKGARETVR